jgi:DNA-binding NarL/FixJ family response regulator
VAGRPKVSLETRAAIVVLVAQGRSVAAIARTLGLETSTVNYFLSRTRHSRAARRALLAERIRALADAGATRGEICGRLGLPKSTLWYLRQRFGIAVAPPSRPSLGEREVARLAALAKEGLTQVEIGRRLGIHQSSVSRYLARLSRACPVTSRG